MTQKELKKYLKYNPLTGIFISLNKHNKRWTEGRVLGTLRKDGYLAIKPHGIEILLHRAAWMYVYGEFPDGYIDHINKDKTDNRIENLRDVAHVVNMQNKKTYKNNSSGTMGVGFVRSSGRWRARITVDEKQVVLGTFVLYSDAVNARKNAEVLYGFHENHGCKGL